MSKEKIIGVDHGNGFIKTVHKVFKSGIDTYKTELPMTEGVLSMNGLHHAIGEHIKPYNPDKTTTDEYFNLTLAAIAEEIEANRYARKTSEIILAAGLPIEFYGHQKGGFKSYLEQKKEIFFRYSGIDYAVKIKKADIFPQGMAAVATSKEFLTGVVNIIDVGSGTIDVMQLIDGKPVLSKCISLPLGVLTCVSEIQKHFRMKLNEELDEYHVQAVLQAKESDLPAEYIAPMIEVITDYTNRVLATLKQKGINTTLQKCHFCCGGAIVFEKYGVKSTNFSFNTDIKANAKGYERLSKEINK